jgi:hypothetical protein
MTSLREIRQRLHYLEGCTRILRRMEDALLRNDDVRYISAELDLAYHLDAHSEEVAPAPVKGAEA